MNVFSHHNNLSSTTNPYSFHTVQVALQVLLPEIDRDFAVLIVLAGRKGATGHNVPLADCVNLLADHAMKWANLGSKPAEDKKITIMIFFYPPDKRYIETAGYLDVFDSIKAVLKKIKSEGYNTGDIPLDTEDVMEPVC